MADRKRLIFIMGIILFLTILIPLFFILTGDEDSESTAPEKEQPAAEKELREANLTLYNNEKTVRWEVKAETLTHYEEKARIELVPITVKAYNNDDRRLYILNGTEGIYNSKTGKLIIEGPVRVDHARYQLQAGQMVWFREEDRLRGSGGVKVIHPSYTLKGDNFVTDPGITSVDINSNRESRASLQWKGQNDEKRND